MSATIRAARACASTLLFHSLRLQAFRGAVPHVLVVVDRVPCALQKVVAEGYLQVLRAYQRDGAAYLAHDSDSVASAAAAAPPEAVETPHPSHDGTLFVSLAPGTETPCGSAGFTAAAAPPQAPPCASGEDPAPLSYSLMPFRCESFLDDVKRLQRFFRHCGDGRHTPSSLEVNKSDAVAPPAPSRAAEAAVWSAVTFEAEYDALCPLLGPLLSSQGEPVEEAADSPRWRALFTGPPRELLGCVLVQEHAFQNELRRYRLRLGLFDLGMRVAEHCHLRIMSHNADRLAEAGQLRAVLDDDEVFSYARSCAFRPTEVLCLAKAIADSIDLHSWHRAGAAQAAAPASVAAALHNPVLQAVFNDGALQGGATAAAGGADLETALRLPIEGPGVPLSVVCRDASKVLTYAGGMEDCLTNTGYYAAAYAPERNDVALHRERFQAVYSEEGVAGEGSDGEGEGEGAAGAAAVHGRLKKRDFLALRKSKKQQKPGKAQPGSDEDEDGAVSRSAPAGSSMSNSIGGTFPIGEVISESFDLSQLSGSCDVFAYPGAFKQVTLSKPAPFTMTVDRGVVTQLGDGAPAEFVDLISLVRQVEGQCHVRELGIGLNPYVGPAHVVRDVTSFERQWGIHLSLGQRHPLFVKQRERRNADGTVAAAVRVEGPVLKRKAGKYHIDVFVDAAQLRMGDVFAIDFTKGIAVRGLAAASFKVLHEDECVLRYDMASQVAILSMERHARKNAIGVNFLNCLQQAIDVCNAGAPAAASATASATPVRCLIVSSAVPKVFCAGADLKERKEMSVDEARAFVQRLRQTFNNLEDLPIPTIAAIEGKALGGGMELALSLDMRVAGDGAAVGFPETGLAIIPGAGGTVRAPTLLGVSRALELILTAEQVSAQRALELGLVNRVVPAGSALDAAFELAQRISRNGPLGVCAAKKAVRSAAGKPRAEAMQVEAAQYEVVLATEDRLEGLKAFAEHRTPVYKGK